MLGRAESVGMDPNCVDALGRGALALAIDAENLAMVQLLVVLGVQTGDALLHAVDAGFVEAAQLLLEHEELVHTPNTPYVRQANRPAKTSTYCKAYRNAHLS